MVKDLTVPAYSRDRGPQARKMGDSNGAPIDKKSTRGKKKTALSGIF
jgi:hypothetical protein